MNLGNPLFHVNKKKEFSSWGEREKDTKVINIRIDKSVPHFYVGRGSIYGNPFSHKESKLASEKTETREEAVRKYYHYLLEDENLLMKAKDLHGETLGCFCYGKMCHADVISLIADCSYIHEPIELNYKYNGNFVINESQYEIMDERRLALLSEIHESKFILLKKEGPLQGFIHLNGEFEIGEEVTIGENSVIYNVDKKDEEFIEVEFKNAHYLTPIFSIFEEKLDRILVSKGSKGIVKNIFKKYI